MKHLAFALLLVSACARPSPPPKPSPAPLADFDPGDSCESLVRHSVDVYGREWADENGIPERSQPYAIKLYEKELEEEGKLDAVYGWCVRHVGRRQFECAMAANASQALERCVGQ